MRSLLTLTYLLFCFVRCSNDTCDEQATFTVGSEGGTYEYCSWKFIIPAGALSKATNITVNKSNTVSVKNMTHIGLEHPTNGQLEIVPLELDTAPGFETIEIQVQDSSAIVNATKIALCPGAELMVSERIGANGADTTATPIIEPDQEDPCFELFTNDTKLDQPVYAAAAGTDWSDSWERLRSNSIEFYNKYINGYTVIDSYVMCSYGGFQLASYLVPAECQNFTGDLICKATLPFIAAALPLVLVPPLKQGVCAAAKAAVFYSIGSMSRISGLKFDTICNFVNSAMLKPEFVKDVFGCSVQKSCGVFTTRTIESLNSKWIAADIRKCQEMGF